MIAPLSISICIATHDRAFLLQSALEGIALQKRSPDEIVISDSSNSKDSEQVVDVFQKKNPHLNIIYIKSECKALPWHRWNGVLHSTSEIVYFMDDDIILSSNALEMLDRTYIELFSRYGVEQIAGVGFYTFLDDGTEKLRRPNSFEERWLGITNAQSASITIGGIGVPPKGMTKNSLIEVGRLSGGRMSFRKDVLVKIGHLDKLVDLFNNNIGPSEDTVLSYYAGTYGKLFMLTYPLVIHPNDERAVHTVAASGGWYKGVMETWGRAHTMRWMATDLRAYRNEWVRVATLELLRSLWWGILRHPFTFKCWTRFSGALYGNLLGIFRLNTIKIFAGKTMENQK